MLDYDATNNLRAGRSLFLLFLSAISLSVCAAPQCSSGDTLFSVGQTTAGQTCDFTDIQSAIDLARSCSGTTTILVTPSLAYTAQHLQIHDQHVILRGARVCGSKGPSNPVQVAIDATGHTGDSTITVKGKSYVTLQYLAVTGAQEASLAHGGGIFFDGRGMLTLDDTVVHDNYAGYGGGVYFKGDSDSYTSRLTLLDDTLVAFNTAQASGGGIYIEGNSALVMTGTNSSIYSNQAIGSLSVRNVDVGIGGYGGGIAALDPAKLFIGSPGIPGFGGGAGLGAVDSNSAPKGGGVALLAEGGTTDACKDAATLKMFTVDSSRPAQISRNSASEHGGAIYLHPFAGGALNDFCAGEEAFASELHDFRLAYNTAADGAAIYQDWDSSLSYDRGTAIYFNKTPLDDSSQTDIVLTSLGAVPCTANAQCNRIEYNTAQESKGAPTDGAVILVGTSGTSYLNRTKLQHNTAGNLIRILGNNDHYSKYFAEDAEIHNTLIADNALSREVLRQENDDAHVYIDGATIAHNGLSSAFVLSVHSGIDLIDSLIDEGAAKALNYEGDAAGLYVDGVIAREATGLPLGASVFQADPKLVDPASGDFHPQPGSPALDFAPVNFAEAMDVDGDVRNVDVPGVVNRFGARDLGAYERQIDVAAAANGGVASASSTFNPLFPASAMIDGDRTGAAWMNGGGWNDATFALFPDTAEVHFSGVRPIRSIAVYTLQDNFLAGGEPSDTLTFSQYGLTAFDVQILDQATMTWATVQSITGNNLVKRTIRLAAVTATSAVRIVCKGSRDGQYSRIVEIEVWGG